MVVLLVFPPQSPQDLQAFLTGGLLHCHRLESPLKGRVLLYIFSVLHNSGGADELQLASGQGGLQDVGRVHGPLRAAGADDGVNLVQKQDHIARSLHLLDQPLHPLLKLASVLGAGDHARQVHCNDAPVFHCLRHHSPGDPLGQSLQNRGLSHARLANKAGVVLCPTAQDLHQPLDLFFSANDRIQLPLRRLDSQVCAVLLQDRVPAPSVLLRLLHVLPWIRAGTDKDVLTQLLKIDIQSEQDPCGHAVHVPQNGKEHMLCPCLLGAEPHGLLL